MSTADERTYMDRTIKIVFSMLTAWLVHVTPLPASPPADNRIIEFRAPIHTLKKGENTEYYQINNYNGDVIAHGKAGISSDSQLKADVSLPTGFYEIRFPALNAAFGLISAPDQKKHSDYYGIDAAMSWFAPIHERSALKANADRLGFGPIRERLRWEHINPANSRWDWETFLGYDSLRKLYGSNRIIEVSHDSPRWIPKSRGGYFPADLIATDRAWVSIAEHWHGNWTGLEAWNEPNLERFSGNQPADQYAPYVRTLRHALDEVRTNTPLGGGVFSGFNEQFIELTALNGVLDEVDFISFHYYADPLGLEGRVAGYRAWLARHGRASKPLWLTEAGKPWSLQAAPTRILTPQQVDLPWVGRNARPSATQGALIALAHAMLAIEAKACGVARYTPFMYLRLSENNQQFGMLDDLGTPMRSLAAYATVVRLLDEASYVGDVRFPRGAGVRRARAFQTPANNRSLLIAAYTGTIDPEASLPLPFAALAAYGADGRMLPISASNTVSAADGIVYLVVDKKHLSNILNTQTNAARLLRIAQQPVPARASPTDVILQPIIPDSTASARVEGYQVEATRGRFPMQIKINNLSLNATHQVALTAGRYVSPRFSVPPRSSMVVDMSPWVQDFSMQAGGIRHITITATSDTATRIAPVVLALTEPPSMMSKLVGNIRRAKEFFLGVWQKQSFSLGFSEP